MKIKSIAADTRKGSSYDLWPDGVWQLLRDIIQNHKNTPIKLGVFVGFNFMGVRILVFFHFVFKSSDSF